MCVVAVAGAPLLQDLGQRAHHRPSAASLSARSFEKRVCWFARLGALPPSRPALSYGLIQYQKP